MLTFLGEILNGILELPYLLVNLVITSINGWILLLAAIVKLIMEALPAFPARPSIAGVGIEWLVWFIPITAMLAAFGLMLSAWLLWMAYTIIAKKVGMIA